MSAVAKPVAAPRHGSVADVVADTGLGARTIRRPVESGAIPSLKVGRRVLIPFEDVDRYILGRGDRPDPGRQPVMATIHPPAEDTATAEAPYVPPIGDEELARRNRAAVELLESWESEGDEQEQRETMAVLREGLGAGRTLSTRPHFP